MNFTEKRIKKKEFKKSSGRMSQNHKRAKKVKQEITKNKTLRVWGKWKQPNENNHLLQVVWNPEFSCDRGDGCSASSFFPTILNFPASELGERGGEQQKRWMGRHNLWGFVHGWVWKCSSQNWGTANGLRRAQLSGMQPANSMALGETMHRAFATDHPFRPTKPGTKSTRTSSCGGGAAVVWCRVLGTGLALKRGHGVRRAAAEMAMSSFWVS